MIIKEVEWKERKGGKEGEREREREKKRKGEVRERDEESMRIGKERKRAKRDRNSTIFGVVRKYLIGEEMGKKGIRKVQNPYFISINRMIRKYILSFHPIQSLKNRCAKIVCLR